MVKGRDIPLPEIRAFDADYDLSVLQRGGHGAAVNAEHRHPQRCNEHRPSGNNNENGDRAPQCPAVAPLILQPRPFPFDLLRGGQGDGGFFLFFIYLLSFLISA